jgi:hypothetical protein
MLILLRLQVFTLNKTFCISKKKWEKKQFHLIWHLPSLENDKLSYDILFNSSTYYISCTLIFIYILFTTFLYILFIFASCYSVHCPRVNKNLEFLRCCNTIRFSIFHTIFLFNTLWTKMVLWEHKCRKSNRNIFFYIGCHLICIRQSDENTIRKR